MRHNSLSVALHSDGKSARKGYGLDLTLDSARLMWMELDKPAQKSVRRPGNAAHSSWTDLLRLHFWTCVNLRWSGQWFFDRQGLKPNSQLEMRHNFGGQGCSEVRRHSLFFARQGEAHFLERRFVVNTENHIAVVGHWFCQLRWQIASIIQVFGPAARPGRCRPTAAERRKQHKLILHSRLFSYSFWLMCCSETIYSLMWAFENVHSLAQSLPYGAWFWQEHDANMGTTIHKDPTWIAGNLRTMFTSEMLSKLARASSMSMCNGSPETGRTFCQHVHDDIEHSVLNLLVHCSCDPRLHTRCLLVLGWHTWRARRLLSITLRSACINWISRGTWTLWVSLDVTVLGEPRWSSASVGSRKQIGCAALLEICVYVWCVFSSCSNPPTDLAAHVTRLPRI